MNILALDVGLIILAVGYDSKHITEFNTVQDIQLYVNSNGIDMVLMGHPALSPITKLKPTGQAILALLGNKVKLVSEYMTSKVCPSCNHIMKASKRIVKCKECKLTMNRDHVGAINIYKKYIGSLFIRASAPAIEDIKPVQVAVRPPDISQFFNCQPLQGRINIEF